MSDGQVRYLLALNEDVPDGWQVVKKTWPNHHIISNRLAVILDDEDLNPYEIADLAGMNDQGRVWGIVVSLLDGEFSGYNDDTLWKWIDNIS